MIEAISNIFEVAKQRMDYYESIIAKVEKEPELILTDLYIEETPDNLLAFLVNNIEETSLINFQGYLYRIIIPYLKSKFNIDGLDFEFMPEVYPSPLTITQNGLSIGDLYIYQRAFVIRTDEKSAKVIKQIDDLNDKMKEINLKGEELEMAKINPLALGGSNPIKLVDIALRKKNYMKNINKDINSLGEEIFELQKEMTALQIALEKAHQDFIEAEYIQERIIRKFKNNYQYKIIDPTTIEEDTSTIEVEKQIVKETNQTTGEE